MKDLTSQSWFGWALVLVIGLPIALIALTELHGWLVRRGSAMAGPVAMLRNFALPAGAMLVLFTKVWELEEEATWVRLLATVFGFLVIVLFLAALNVVLFRQAGTGTWRERMPSIFVDIARLVLIVTGLALLFSWVWGANVAGLFAALGVTSIILGFALQNAVGSIISGLLLLFEQPFRLGDWLDTGSTRGRVVEVNWRAVHIETGNGVQIIPNATLAGASFCNLSQPAGNHVVTVPTTFAAEDPPDVVRALLDRVAGDVPVAGIEPSATTAMTGPRAYATTIRINTPAAADDVTATFLRWTWYAARRAGLHLDGAAETVATPERVLAAVRQIAPAMHLREDEVDSVAAGMTVERWAAGEVLLHEGEIPDALRCVLRGRVGLYVGGSHGELVPVGELSPGEFLGATALTQQPIATTAIVFGEVDVLAVPADVIEDVVRSHPALARDLGRTIEVRRTQASAALASGSPAQLEQLHVGGIHA